MMYSMRKERLYLFSPAAMIFVKSEIDGGVEVAALRRAIEIAVRANAILNTHIVITDDGQAFYQTLDEPICPVRISGDDWPVIFSENEQRPFDIAAGELIRFYITPGNPIKLIICAHHLAGDGLSIAYLLQDIMIALSGGVPTYKPVRLFDPSSIPEALPTMTRIMSKFVNSHWKHGGRVFTFKDRARLLSVYPDQETSVFKHTITNGQYDALINTAHNAGVTINTMITTAFLRAAHELTSVCLAASIRDGYEGMGNYATGFSISHIYDDSLSFTENARAIHAAITAQLDNPRKKFFLLAFMDALNPGLIDAAYFAAYDSYPNPTARQIAQMFGYMGEPKGISITNLTKLPIRQAYGRYAISDFSFVPPLVPNAQNIIGVATLGSRMVITMHVRKNDYLEAQQALFKKAIGFLEFAK